MYAEEAVSQEAFFIFHQRFGYHYLSFVSNVKDCIIPSGLYPHYIVEANRMYLFIGPQYQFFSLTHSFQIGSQMFHL